MLAENLHLESSYRVSRSLNIPPDIGGLPSVDDALYLFNTVGPVCTDLQNPYALQRQPLCSAYFIGYDHDSNCNEPFIGIKCPSIRSFSHNLFPGHSTPSKQY
ncbi:uncharacterized protein BDV14DRAFT_166852 [Aspergillus stella-maris]|uniref:uncharacterized protein n=1 Tax=Aspergillus stella-maris TaxID=1810926 RepID=UPI003CCD9590